MTAEPLDLLLDRLGTGDMQAAEQIMRDYEPYLRMVVRRYLPNRLRGKFDSLDVVQSVWVHALRGLGEARWQFTEKAELQALLVTITRRRLISRYRHHRADIEREQPAADLASLPAPQQPRPSEVAQAEELWSKMLALCPAEHHELLKLRRQGLLLEEIAARTGMHEGSVRRILRQLARQLACQEQPFFPAGADAP